MLPYWLFFLLPMLAALHLGPTKRRRLDGTRAAARFSLAWILVFLCLTVIIGFRHQVGGDWGSYIRYLYVSRSLNFIDLATQPDPAFWALNMLSNWLGFGIVGVNLIGGAFFSAGLIIFCLNLPRAWLALSCAVPYLIIVVAMGYTRQGIAVGLTMIGMVALQRNRYISFVAWVLIAALFHKSAVVLIPLAALVVNRNRFQAFGFIGLFALAGYDVILSDHVDHLSDAYQDGKIESSGALVRLGMNAIPGFLLIFFNKRFSLSKLENRLWIIVSAISIIMLIIVIPTGLSTALDRMALYFIPLQLVVFSHFPDVIGKQGGRNQAIVAGILSYYAVVLFIWLNFAVNASYWLPYRMGLG